MKTQQCKRFCLFDCRVRVSVRTHMRSNNNRKDGKQIIKSFVTVHDQHQHQNHKIKHINFFFGDG